MVNVPINKEQWTLVSVNDTFFQLKDVNDTFVYATESVDTPQIIPTLKSNVMLIFPRKEYEFKSENGSRLYIYSIKDTNVIRDL